MFASVEHQSNESKTKKSIAPFWWVYARARVSAWTQSIELNHLVWSSVASYADSSEQSPRKNTLMHRISIITVINIIIKESETLILCIHLKLFTLWLLFFIDVLVCVCVFVCVCVCVTECRFCFSCSLPCNGQVFMWPSFTLYTTTRRVHPSIWPNRCELCYVHRNFRNRSIHTFKTEENVYFPFIYFWFAGDRSLSKINVTRTVQLKCIAHVIIQWYADANWNY